MKSKLLLLVVVVGLLYGLTISPDVYLEDSGELVTAAYFLGIAHPSGYPLYTILGKLFTFLPFGTIAFRLNLMSAVFGVLTAAVLFLTLARLGRILGYEDRASQWIALPLALLFAAGRDFWSQSLVAEVYTLNSFLVITLILFFLQWFEERTPGRLYAMALWSGLGLANHPLFGLILPIVWAVIFLLGFQGNRRQMLNLFIFFLLGLSVYLYLPLRSAANPGFVFQEVKGLGGSINHVLRTSYNDFAADFSGKGIFLVSLAKTLVLNLTMVLPLAALGGMVFLLRQKRIELLALLLLGFLTSALLPILLRQVVFSEEVEFAYRVYYFQAYLLVICLAFVFLAAFRQWSWVLIFVLVGLAGYEIYQNFKQVDLSQDQVASYYEAKLQDFPQDAVYVLVGDDYRYESELFVLLYLQKVKKLRPDVTVVDASKIMYLGPRSADAKYEPVEVLKLRSLYLDEVVKNFAADRPVYASFPPEAYSPKLKTLSQLAPAELEFRARQTWDLAYRDFLAGHFYELARYEHFNHNTKSAGTQLLEALEYDNQVGSEDYRAFRDFRKYYIIE